MTTEEKSDIHVLRGFIHTFLSRAPDDKADSVIQAEYKKALSINPLNKNLQVEFAINLSNKKDATYIDLTMAIAIFDQANLVFQNVKSRALTTYFSKDFVGFWRKRTEEKLGTFYKALRHFFVAMKK